MNIKSIAALAATVIATTAWAGETKEQKCGAGSCGKKEHTCKEGEKCDTKHKDASCSKKDGACSKKEASCSKKDASCSKK
jgi:hypothetical protein